LRSMGMLSGKSLPVAINVFCSSRPYQRWPEALLVARTSPVAPEPRTRRPTSFPGVLEEEVADRLTACPELCWPGPVVHGATPALPLRRPRGRLPRGTDPLLPTRRGLRRPARAPGRPRGAPRSCRSRRGPAARFRPAGPIGPGGARPPMG
jgi:hypothetical protein